MPIPTEQQLDAAQQLYQVMRGWSTAYELLHGYCEHYPDNANRFITLNKVMLINKMYSTRILAEGHLAQQIADHDAELQPLLAGDDAGAVQIIALCGIRREFSFATKFAHLHNPTGFPIWDSRAQATLEVHEMVPAAGGTLAERYERFRGRVREIIDAYAGLTFHQVDQYLWLKGQKLPGAPMNQEVTWASGLYPRIWARL
jgi:hypothetical protein